MVDFKKVSLVIIAILLLSFPNLAAEDGAADDMVLTFDERPPLPQSFHFEDDGRIMPKDGDFELISFATMSNRKGHRWALITVQNSTTGNRILTHRHLVATFADGERRFAKFIEVSLTGGAVFTEAVEFGRSKFPIVSVEMR